MIIVTNFCERLIKLHNEKGVFIKDIAEVIGVSTKQYARYEKGINEPTLSVIVKLCEYFQCSSDYLLGLSDKPERR